MLEKCVWIVWLHHCVSVKLTVVKEMMVIRKYSADAVGRRACDLTMQDTMCVYALAKLV